MSDPAPRNASVGQLLQAAFEIFGSAWRRLLAIAALAGLLATVVATAAAWLLDGADPGAEGLGRFVGANLAAAVLGLAVLCASFGPLVGTAFAAAGRSVPPDERRWALGSLVQGAIFTAGILGPGLIAFTALEIDTEEGVMGLLLIAGLVASVAAARLLAATPALVAEGLGPVDAMRRSDALVSGRTLAMFGLLLIVGTLDRIVSRVAEGILGSGGEADPLTFLATAYFVLLGASALVMPITAAAAVAAYLDRVRAEGRVAGPVVAGVALSPSPLPAARPPGAQALPWEQSPPL